MQCAVCGHKNSSGSRTCAACGAALGLAPSGTPVSGTPGIKTGGTHGQGAGAATNVYTPHLSKGVRLQNGHYAVGDVLGQGGFGITYKGGDLTLRRYVAIKELFPAGFVRQGNTVHPGGGMSEADYAGVKTKFLEEARILARFSHPSIVRVFGTWEENNTAYMAMEFLEGRTLSTRLSEEGALPEKDAVHIIEQVAQALVEVHKAGLIHRDLKPDNICLTPQGRVVLIDFGTARNFASDKTVRQTTLLTPGYAPLEQYGQQARFGTYTDIYALAATLYHALTGQIPPQAPDRASGVELKSPRELNPGISAGVSGVVVWAMQLKATERPQNIQQFLQALKDNTTPTPTPTPTPTNSNNVGTVLLPASPNSAPTPPADWGQPPVQHSTPSQFAASIQVISHNQILTNAAPQDVLQMVERAFRVFGITHPTVDAASYRVLGSTGVDLRSWAQNVVAQITQDGHGTLITVSSTPAAHIVDYGRGAQETQRLLIAIQDTLRGLPAAPLPPVNYPPPVASPYGGGYAPALHPPVKMQGGSVLALGLVGFFCCGICAPIAWINGNNALASYGDSDPGDRGTVQAGRILGIVGTILWALWISLSCAGILSS